MDGKQNNKNTYGLVGEKLGHSFSPLLHSRFGDYRYDLIEVPKDRIDGFFKMADFAGVNVTIPYKEVALKHCIPDEMAKAIGCVNTLVCKEASGKKEVRGYNTDTYGFEYMAGRAGIDMKGAAVTILGSGGTCRTAAVTASRLGAASITVVSRHPSDMGLNTACPVKYVSYDDDYQNCEVLINTTPVGMYPDIGGCPVLTGKGQEEIVDIINNYVNLKAVMDVVYNPLRTRLVYNAQKCGIKASGGLPMLVAQGYFASKLFAGYDLGYDPVGDLTDREQKLIEEVTAEIEDSVSNIVLYGMPGSGKSSAGRVVAQKLGLEFTDTDDIFTTDNQMTPGYCITHHGEEEFRRLEKQAVYKAAQSGKKVIATGGGVVLDPENRELLALNGRTFFLNRKLSELATKNRPLSEGDENLKALYYKRLPIYLSSSETVIDVDTDVKGVAQKIIDSLHKSGSSKMRILVINGPNLNMLGIREPDIYGRQTYEDLIRSCRQKADEIGVEVYFYQSNHEGDLVDIIQQSYGTTDGIVINPGAYTHTSVALLDALKCVGIPAIEVHISDVDSREEFRQVSYIRSYVARTISGHGLAGYTEAIEELYRRMGEKER